MFKHLQYLVIFSLGIISQVVNAQVATFDNGIFNIPQVAAMVNGEPTYFNEVQLASDVEGKFTLLEATPSNLVSVDSVEVSVAESLPVQVSLTVTGNKSVPCVQLQTPAIFLQEATFTIVLAETTLGPAETCIAVLEPFETNIPLDVSDLDSGNYAVSVNGLETSFSL